MLLAIGSCTAQVTDTGQPKNPCDPPPPCLPAREQPFSFTFEWKPGKRQAELPRVALSNTGADEPVAILPVPQKADVYRVLFSEPAALQWVDKNRFTAYLLTGNRLDTLQFTVKEIIMDCCPQLTIVSITQNGKCICEDCPTKQPVKWRR